VNAQARWSLIQQLGNVNMQEMWTTDTSAGYSKYMGLLITDTITRDWTMGVTWEWWSLRQQLGYVKMQEVRTTGTTPVDRARRDVPITDKAAGDGERMGTMFTDIKSSHYQPPSSLCLTSLFFVRKGCMFIGLACFPLNFAPLSSLTRWATDFHETWCGGGHLKVTSC